MKFPSKLTSKLRASLKLVFTGMLISGIHAVAADKHHEVKHTFTYDYNDLSIVQEGAYDIVTLKDAPLSEDEVGAPALPVVYANILIPAGSTVKEVTAVAKNEIKIAEGLLVHPIQPATPLEEGLKPAFVGPNPVAYQKATKRELFSSQKSQHARGMTIVPVQLHPIRVVPVSGELYLAQEIEVTVTVNKASRRLQAKGGKSFEEFISSIKQSVVNPDEPEGVPLSTSEDLTQSLTDLADESGIIMPLSGSDAEYLIITSATLLPTFQRLADHRATTKGLSSKVISTATIYASYAGVDNQTKIRNCIKDYVTNHGTLYVVLGGDNYIIPERNCPVAYATYSTSTSTDLYYAGLDGTWDLDGDRVYGELTDVPDLLADVWLGRIPIQTATQANAYINKLISYELSPPPSITRKFLIGGRLVADTYTTTSRPTDLLHDGHAQFTAANHPKVSDVEIWQRRIFRDYVQKHGYNPSRIGILTDTISSWDSVTCGDYAASAANMVTRLSEGWNFTIWVAHGSTGGMKMDDSTVFNTINASNLTGLTTVYYTGSCHTSRFSAEPSLSEAMLRNPRGGSLIYIGCTHYNWSTTYQSFMRKYCDLVFHDQVKNAADAFYRHKAAFIAMSGSDNTYRWNNFSLSFQGDPAFSIIGTELTGNMGPVATNDAYFTTTGTSLSVTSANGVLKNDTDANGDPLTATLITAPSSGTLSFNSTGAFTYKPAAGVTGKVSFTYKAKDAALSSNIATVTISITSPTLNRVPVAASNSYTMNQGTVLSVSAPGVLGNDTDADGDLLTASISTIPTHGTLSLSSNGAFTYTPVAGYSGPDSFTYKVSDGKSTSSGATVSITINPIISVKPVVRVKASANAAEPATKGSFQFSLPNGAIGTPLTVNYAMNGGTAVAGSDYIALSGTVVIPAGTSVVTVSVVPKEDLLAEGQETVIAQISTSVAYTLYSSGMATVYLNDNDKPTISISIPDSSLSESLNKGQIRIVATPAPLSPLTVFYTMSGTAVSGTDYVAPSGSVVIPAGATSVLVDIVPKDDALVEGIETVILKVSAGTKYSGTPSVTLKLYDSELPIVNVSATDNVCSEAGPNTGTFTFTRNSITSSSLIVTYTIGGSALNGTDYILLSGTVTIPAGAASTTVRLTPVNDTIVEGAQSARIRTSSRSSYQIGSADMATISIADND
jgi:hypothetical protein